jgi:hypothetical protein
MNQNLHDAVKHHIITHHAAHGTAEKASWCQHSKRLPRSPAQAIAMHNIEHREARNKNTLTHHPPSLSNLGRETSLDGLYRTTRSTAVACDEVETVLTLGEIRVGRTACLARNVLDNVPPKNVLQLLLLETTLDDQAFLVGKRTARTQLSKQELSNVLVGTLHPLADLGKVGEDGLLVSFTHALRWGDLVALGA